VKASPMSSKKKKKTSAEISFFLLVRVRNTKKPLPSRVMCRAQNNSRSKDNVLPKLIHDLTNWILEGHFD